MKKTTFASLALSAVALTTSLVGCTDYDMGLNDNNAEFTKNFVEIFGSIDPKQDWNMAQQYTANIDLAPTANGVLEIYTEGPSVPGSKYIGKVNVVNGKATLKFDGLKNSTLFYAQLKNNDGNIIENGYYPTEGNVLNIRSANAGTRSLSSPIPTVGDLVTLPVERIVPGAISDLLSNKGTYENYYDMCTKMKVTEGGYEIAKWDMDNQTNTAHGLMYKEGDEVNIPNLYRLNGVDFSVHDNGYTGKYLRTYFGDYINTEGVSREGVFKEGIDHVALMHHANANYHVSPDVEYTITDGDVIDGFGQIELDCIWRGTAYNYDFFGYYYYDPADYAGGEPTAEELWNIRKYILINEKAAGTSNWIGGEANSLTQGMTAQWKHNPSTGQNDILHYEGQSWTDLTGMECATYMNNQEMNLIRGTRLQLAYFGKDGTASGKFDFPVGTKIGFFMGWNQSSSTPYNNRIFFSKCDKTYQLFRRQYKENNANKSTMEADLLPQSFKDSHTKNNSDSYEGEDVRPFAATFTLNDVVIFGFGDEIAGDKDLNDICFFVNGTFEKPEEIHREDIPDPEVQSWILACEDLGNIEDFDFNDVVLKISHAAEDTKATVTAMAAGGTLPIYVTYNGETLKGPNNEEEFHSWFGNGGYSVSTMINTNSGANSKGGSITIPVEPSFTMSSVISGNKMGGFGIRVERDDRDGNAVRSDISAPADGTAPQIMCLPGNWIWPVEKHRIDSAYPAFGTWGENYNVTNWYMKYDRPHLVKQPDYASQEVTPVVPGGEQGGEQGGGTTITTYTLPVSEDSFFTDSNGYGYAIDLSSVDYTDATKIEYKLIADETTNVTFYHSNTTWDSGFNYLFTESSTTTNTTLTIDVLAKSWAKTDFDQIYLHASPALTNASFVIKVTTPKK